MRIKQHIPNFVTCLNLVCGCLAVHFAYRGYLTYSGFAIFTAAVFDFADGLVARALHVKSELGKQLDSLADVVSFGVAPGVIMFQLMMLGEKAWKYGIPPYIAAVSLLLPVFSALRLAKFNIDTRQTDSFIGLPTPAMGLVIASLPLLISRQFESPLFPFNDWVLFFVLNPWVLISATVLFAFLMVSNLPLFAMKFRTWSWSENKLKYVFVIVSILLILLFFFVAIPLVIVLYILMSLIKHFTDKKIKSQSL